MKHLSKYLSAAVISVILISFSMGCTSGSQVKEKSKNDVKKDDKIKTDETSSTETANDYPDWFLTQPKDEKSIYAVGVAQKQNPMLARDTAIARARNEIARVIGVKVSTMTRDFLEEAGVGKNAQSLEFTQIVSKQVSDSVLSGSQVDKVKIDKTTNPDTFYVLVRLDLKDMSGAIDDLVKSNSAYYSKLSANKAFEELADEIKKMKSSELESPKVITDDTK
jgi:hypothetical protein